MDAISVSRVSKARDDAHICLVSELFALVRKLWIRGRLVQTRAMPSVKVLSAREEARCATGRKVVRGNADNGSSLFSASGGKENEKECGGAEVEKKGRVYRLERVVVVRAGEVGAVSQTLPSVLLKWLKVHRIPLVRVECMFL